MKYFSLFAASVLLLSNFSINASDNKSKLYVSQSNNDYLDGYFIYNKCLKTGNTQRRFPGYNNKSIAYKNTNDRKTKTHEEYAKAQEISPYCAAKYIKTLKDAGFLKATRMVTPKPLSVSTSPMDEVESLKENFICLSVARIFEQYRQDERGKYNLFPRTHNQTNKEFTQPFAQALKNAKNDGTIYDKMNTMLNTNSSPGSPSSIATRLYSPTQN